MNDLKELMDAGNIAGIMFNYCKQEQLQYNNDGVWADYDYSLRQLLQELLLELETGERRVRVKQC